MPVLPIPARSRPSPPPRGSDGGPARPRSRVHGRTRHAPHAFIVPSAAGVVLVDPRRCSRSLALPGELRGEPCDLRVLPPDDLLEAGDRLPAARTFDPRAVRVIARPATRDDVALVEEPMRRLARRLDVVSGVGVAAAARRRAEPADVAVALEHVGAELLPASRRIPTVVAHRR